jgi:hypothetical protein
MPVLLVEVYEIAVEYNREGLDKRNKNWIQNSVFPNSWRKTTWKNRLQKVHAVTVVFRNIVYEDVKGLNCIRTAQQIVPDLCDSGSDSDSDSYYRPAPSNKQQLFFHHQHHWDCSREKNVLSVKGMSQFLSCSVVVVVGLYRPGV